MGSRIQIELGVDLSASIPNISAIEEAIMTAFDGVAVLVDGCYVWQNEMHSNMYGYSLEETVGASWKLLYDDDEIARIEADIFPLLQSTGKWTGVCIGRHKSGRKFEVELSLRICRTGELVCCCRDISATMRAERAQRQLASFLGGMTSLLQAAIDTNELTLYMTRMLRLVADNVLQTEVLLFVPGRALTGIVPAQWMSPPQPAERTLSSPMAQYNVHICPELMLPDIPNILKPDNLSSIRNWVLASCPQIREDTLLEFSPLMRSSEAIGVVILGHSSSDFSLKYLLLKFLDPVVYALVTLLLSAIAQKQNSEILSRQQRMVSDFNVMARNAGVMVWRWNLATGRVVSIDPDTQVKLWGDSLDWAYQHFEMIVPEDRERVERGLQQLQNQSISVFDAEYAIITEAREKKVVRSLALYLPSEEGEEEIQGVTYDTTERYALHSRLRESEDNYRRLFEWMPDGLLLAVKAQDSDVYRVVEINDAMRGMMNISFSTSCEGGDLRELLPSSAYTALEDVFADGQSPYSMCTRDIEIKSYGEKKRYLRLVISRDSNSQHSEKLFLRAIDVDSQRRREIELQRISELNQASTDELRRVTRLKDEFLANMSHELRTPLNGILGACEILEDGVMGALTTKQLEMIEICKSSGHHLLGIINDILDLSKIDAGKMQLDFIRVDISQFCDELYRLTLPLAHQAGVSVEVELSNAASAEMFVDRVRFRQVLLNLLANAIEYSPARSIVKLHCSWMQESHTLQFDVIDTGMGIDTLKIAGLFQPFEQVSTGLNRTHEGTGLGLTLVKKLTQLHFGHVRVASEVGKGSCFRIVIPDAKEAELLLGSGSACVLALPQAGSLSAPVEVLIVDSVDVRMGILRDTLNRRGCRAIGLHSVSELPSALLCSRPRFILIELGRELEALTHGFSLQQEGLESLIGVYGISDFILENDTISPRGLYDLSMDLSGVVAQPFTLAMLDPILHST